MTSAPVVLITGAAGNLGQAAAQIFAQPDVDGGLIGGAALKAQDFLTIIAAAG